MEPLVPSTRGNAHDLRGHLRLCPLIASLGGIRPADAEGVAEALIGAGIRVIEISLTSPDAIDTIARLVDRFASAALIGAGTVIDPADVPRVAAAGGRLIGAPNTDPEVIRSAVDLGLVALPGFFTPSELIAASRAGAEAFRLFPADAFTPAVLRSYRPVLPKDALLLVSGGITPNNMWPWMDAGATGFSLATGLYRPGDQPQSVAQRARAYAQGRGLRL